MLMIANNTHEAISRTRTRSVSERLFREAREPSVRGMRRTDQERKAARAARKNRLTMAAATSSGTGIRSTRLSCNR